MPSKDNWHDRVSRRGFLGSCSAIAGASVISTSAFGSSTPEPVVLKGRSADPVTEAQVDSARERVLDRLRGRTDTPEEVIFDGDPMPENGYIAGYGLAVEDGVPIERTVPITQAEILSSYSEPPSGVKPKTGASRGGTERNLVTLSSSSISDRELEREAHSRIDRFASSVRESAKTPKESIQTQSKEPEWTRIGTISRDADALFEHEGSQYRGGKIDLYVEVYKLKNSSSSDTTQFACVPVGTSWPGQKLSNAKDFRNWSTYMSQNWDDNEAGGLEIGDWGPKKDKTGSIDWSLSIGFNDDEIQGGVSVSYDTPYIQRINKSDYNATVAHRYNYPSEGMFLPSPGARDDIVGVKSLGEARLNTPVDENDDILTVDLSGTFYGELYTYTPVLGAVYKDYYPSADVSLSCTKHRLNG